MSERTTVYLTDRKARQLVELALVHMASPDTLFRDRIVRVSSAGF
jgi:hypothetical protein